MSRKKRPVDSFVVFSGNSNPGLADKICLYLKTKPGEAVIGRFSDGEIQVEIKENVRRREVFVIQSTCNPANDNLMELLLMIDALKRSSARRITAVLPYFGYARQDKKVAPRVPISAKLVADMIQTAGAHRIITMDLHAGQIQGFFNLPVDNLFARPIFIRNINMGFKKKKKSLVIVSPDAGGVERARAYAKRLKCGLAIIDKRRDQPNKAKAMAVVGEVSGKSAILLDDMSDTAGTLAEAAKALDKAGCLEVYAYCVHPVLSGKALSNLKDSPIKKLITTDTIPLSQSAAACKKIEVLSIASMIAEGIKRSFTGDSVTSLFL